MTLTNKHLSEVCLLFQSNVTKTCRYLTNDDLDDSKWYCQKLRKEIKDQIDDNIASFDKRSRLKNGIPSGDNCEGYPLLKHIPQGFDVD